MCKLIKNLLVFLILPVVFVSVVYTNLSAQVLNDECLYAIPLPPVENYCSRDGEFTNVGAKPDPEFAQGTAACISLKWANGVWFSFVPRKPAVLIRVLGQGNGGTLRSPKIILFKRCGQYISCSPGKDIGIDELVFDDLNIGQTYFIMVESGIGGEGTFKICVDDFIPVKAPESDCRSAVVLCDKSPFVVKRLEGNGKDQNELQSNICIGGEFASAWYKWTCEIAGRLTFTLTPNNNFPGQIADDLDFALYELPNGLDDCATKKLLRCEGAGANTDALGNTLPLNQWGKCNGPTGLREGETDISEPGGCQGNNNNFVAPIDMEAGKSYVLIINNFSRSGLGFGIEFGGSGTFLGPKPDFDINANKAFECDKSVFFTNKSVTLTDPIVKYTWNFGDRAVPERMNGTGPFEVAYQSFGDKTAALTVETSRGCTVTKIKEFYVDPCCKDTSTLTLDALAKDLRCFNLPEGQILAVGKRGAPEYSFSINGGFFRPNPLFGNLEAGVYKIRVQDIKGCTDTITRVINQPPPITVDAGPDQEIDLGNTTFLNGTYISANGGALLWTPESDFEFNGITGPEVFPKTTTTYTFTVTDNNGCTKEDMVTIRVNKKYDIFAPNIITPDNSGFNDFFNIWANKSVKYVEFLEVYDRWGNLVYQGVDTRAPGAGTLIINDQSQGWDGKFKGLPVVPGVFAWRAGVRFIDDEVKNFAGDLTVLR
jgi:hypothetical protein